MPAIVRTNIWLKCLYTGIRLIPRNMSLEDRVVVVFGQNLETLAIVISKNGALGFMTINRNLLAYISRDIICN